MNTPMIHIHNAQTGETVVREMTDAERADWQARVAEMVPTTDTVTKEQLLAQLQALQAQIESLS
jgi:hypothetical protein